MLPLAGHYPIAVIRQTISDYVTSRFVRHGGAYGDGAGAGAAATVTPPQTFVRGIIPWNRASAALTFNYMRRGCSVVDGVGRGGDNCNLLRSHVTQTAAR